MTQLAIHRLFASFKKAFPAWVHTPIRSLGTAILGPTFFAYRTGYIRSCFQMSAVSKKGNPLPWYTYPSIDFLKQRSYEDKDILEFGGGQSTLWWSKRSRSVDALEGDEKWYKKINEGMPDNVNLQLVSIRDKESNISDVGNFLKKHGKPKYDVIVIDGLYRYEMIQFAIEYLREGGIIICDNSDGYGMQEGFEQSGLQRVDFFGNAPGVVLPHCTSIYFSENSFIFDPSFTIPVISKDNYEN